MLNFDRSLFGDQQERMARALAELEVKTSAHDGTWGLGRADWAADLGAGTLTFTNETFRAVCPVQIVGTYNTLDGSWLWGWDHPSVPEPLAQHAGLVRAFAEKHSLPALLTRTLACSETDAWALTALAAHLGDAQGAYRGPAGTALVFMTFGTVQLQSPEPGVPGHAQA